MSGRKLHCAFAVACTSNVAPGGIKRKCEAQNSLRPPPARRRQLASKLHLAFADRDDEERISQRLSALELRPAIGPTASQRIKAIPQRIAQAQARNLMQLDFESGQDAA